MGVRDLHKNLMSIMSETTLERYRGKKAGVDVAMWLYKGSYTMATELALAEKNGTDFLQLEDTQMYEQYCLKQVELLLKYDIIPILIFEGGSIPTKIATSESRTRKQNISLEKGYKLMDEGNEVASKAAFERAIKVTPKMSRKFFNTMKIKHPEVVCIVAPYEADAQLAYLAITKYVDVVISNDSDCIPYGCPTALFKLDTIGQAHEYRRRHIGAAEEFSFIDWDDLMLLSYCVLAGCDYSPTIYNVGPAEAYVIVNTHKTPDKILEHVLKKYSSVISQDYEALFYRAIMTYRHHIVYDPVQKRQVMLNDYAISEADILLHFGEQPTYLGNLNVSYEVAQGVAEGRLDPRTYSPYDQIHNTKRTNAEEIDNRADPSDSQKNLDPVSKRARPNEVDISIHKTTVMAKSNGASVN